MKIEMGQAQKDSPDMAPIYEPAPILLYANKRGREFGFFFRTKAVALWNERKNKMK